LSMQVLLECCYIWMESCAWVTRQMGNWQHPSIMRRQTFSLRSSLKDEKPDSIIGSSSDLLTDKAISFTVATTTWLTVMEYLCHKWPRICSRSFPRSWLITGFATRLTRRVSLVEQELLTLPEHLSSPPFLRRFVLLDL
jgi:hypothetical protein